ncbi:MAG: GNAT family N-acetyltransferase [Clostridia bacterium]|nr:GNAT family N-acetyltransferase [Clostridia bacterium]
MEQVDIIKFKKEDATFIREHFSSYFSDDSIESIEKRIDYWQNTLGFCITYNGEKVGMISLSDKQDGRLCWGVMIIEKYRRKGIARKAFELIRGRAKERGYSIIASSCAAGNVASVHLHEKVGFKRVKKEINSVGNEMYRWEMEI